MSGLVSMEEVERVAELANLDLAEDEKPRMQRDLNAILEYVAQLNQLDTAGIEPMALLSFPTSPRIQCASIDEPYAAPRRYRARAKALGAGLPAFRSQAATCQGGRSPSRASPFRRRGPAHVSLSIEAA